MFVPYADVEQADHLDAKTVLEEMRRLSHQIFQSLMQEHPNESVSFSPFSLFTLLSYAIYGGIDLDVACLPKERYNRAFQYLSKRYGEKDSPVRIANALVAPFKTTFKPEFLKTSREYYGAEVFRADSDIARIVNSWVFKHTDGLIEKFFDSPPSSLAVLALNALVFHGNWEASFNPDKTRKRPFYLPSGEIKDVLMLSDTRKVALYQNPEYLFLELPFAEEGYSYCICMPLDSTHLEELSQTAVMNIIQKTKPTLVNLHLPKQDISFESEYKEILEHLGFPVNGPFTAMVMGDIKLSGILQKVRVLVHEKGVDAAAVTGGMFCTSVGAPTPTVSIDRPYLYWVVDKKQGMPLFQGCIRDFTPFG